MGDVSEPLGILSGYQLAPRDDQSYEVLIVCVLLLMDMRQSEKDLDTNETKLPVAVLEPFVSLPL